MKNFNYFIIAAIGLVAVAAVHGQNPDKAKKKAVTPSLSTASPSKSYSQTPSIATGAISAYPLTGPGLAEREAAYAPSDAFRKEAMSLYQSGDMTGAETACLKALNAPPVIQGQPQHVPFVAELLGKIYLKEGQYEKAVQFFQSARPNTAGGSLDLNLALAYVRLGDYKHAQEFYSDQATLRYYPQGDAHDLPGTNSPGNLEASILLARGLDAYLEHRYDDALPDLQRANKLAPNNALIAYHCAQILSDKGRYSEAAPLYKIAAATGRGGIGEEARRRSPVTKSAIGVPAQAPQ